ncbi:Type II traffic warden ATPase [Limihaloglobus sulfuriphilus]|uniref:Type II traffic warden ATPase n=1 Tax=Limihaloglobus sulfuriphilus TaxID=1851148 RepID=A0A1Q2MFE3_9BACT|nr:GspE/PulE family protein [Limihaloglobus sulfuriphilus]AQQ71390.1 Type II traffic warden ATPase [Limihaloglobus sulfuriphilus]
MSIVSTLLSGMCKSGIINSSQMQQIEISAAAGHGFMEASVLNGVKQDAALKFLAGELGYEYIDNLAGYVPEPQFLAKFSAHVLLERGIAPILSKEGRVFAVISDPFETTGVDELRLLTGLDIEIGLAPKTDINEFLKKYLGLGADTIQSMVDEAAQSGLQFLTSIDQENMDLASTQEEGASIIRFVNQMLSQAIESRATDVHIEPFENELRVRYRIDGVLQSAAVPPELKQFQPAIVSRIKILSSLDIAEKRVPQDGRIKVLLAGREVDIRVSIIPMLHGEAVVLRLLDCSSVLLGLEKIGMGPHDLAVFAEVIKRPHGIILVTGPTGSGKTTTLYAALSCINDIHRKIVTIEDPIEYQLHGINQIQVSNKTGMSFARGLRSILRHDPDVILVGEIRDLETAEIAVQASLTGHLVFSTLHTNDAPGALTRLVDMGVEPYLVASSLEAVIAQRLIRLICPDCKTAVPQAQTESLRGRYGELIPDKLYTGTGCRECQGTGYKGRKGIFEQMVVSENIRALLLANASSREIRLAAMKDGMKNLRQDVKRYLDRGETTLEEVLRVTKDEMLTTEQ